MTRLPILSAFAFALIGAGAGLSPASAQTFDATSPLIYGGPRYDPPPPRCVCVRAPCNCDSTPWGGGGWRPPPPPPPPIWGGYPPPVWGGYPPPPVWGGYPPRPPVWGGYPPRPPVWGGYPPPRPPVWRPSPW